jgi:LTXXQ motif family protein
VDARGADRRAAPTPKPCGPVIRHSLCSADSALVTRIPTPFARTKKKACPNEAGPEGRGFKHDVRPGGPVKKLLGPLIYVNGNSKCVTIFAANFGGRLKLGRSPMLKIAMVGTTALFLTASSIANAQNAQTSAPGGPERLNAAERNNLTDMRIDLAKAALQLTPEQEKLWPPIESAIRARAEDRKARLAKIGETVGRRADQNSIEVMRNRDPIAFLQRRSEALAQRSADLDKLAEAWQPLYKTLTPEQRQRMAAVAIFVIHEMSDAVDRRRAQAEDED